MNRSIPRVASGLLVASLAAASGTALGSPPHAQTLPAAPSATAPIPPRQPQTGDRGHHEHRGPGMLGDRMMMEIERLRTSLKLDAGQSALWDKAQAMMTPPADRREPMKARRDRVAAMLDDPAFDPRRMAAEMDGAESERHARMTSVRDAWLAVYDSLDPVQRGQAREFLRSHLSLGHGMGAGMGRKPRPDGDAGVPPMAPTPR